MNAFNQIDSGIVSLVNSFSSCHSTFVWERTNKLPNSKLLSNIQFVLPILVFGISTDDWFTFPRSSDLLPLVLKFNSMRKRGQLCSVQFVFGSSKLTGSDESFTNTMEIFGSVMTRARTAYKFIVLLLPDENSFSLVKQYIESFERTRISKYYKLFIVEENWQLNDAIYYYCSKCPDYNFLLEELRIDLVDRLVDLEQLTISLLSYSEQLNVVFSGLLVVKGYNWDHLSHKTAPLVRQYLNLANVIILSYYTRHHTILEQRWP